MCVSVCLYVYGKLERVNKLQWIQLMHWIFDGICHKCHVFSKHEYIGFVFIVYIKVGTILYLWACRFYYILEATLNIRKYEIQDLYED